ncbi:MAG: heavy metal translocating P-type ATPase [Bowdeniella nasicola]|nr:heavy metal translocating P-type ATPase [Bowdeniella nasicola]
MTIRSFFRRYPWVAATLSVGIIALALSAVGFSPVVGEIFGQQITLVQAFVSAFALVVAADQFRGMIRDLMSGAWGIDLLAIVAIVATVIVGEYAAALVVCLMLSGGEALEDYAASRARSELTGLLSRAPQEAHRVEADGSVVTVPISDVHVGDTLMIRPSEVLPVDGILLSEEATMDESSLTGESLPVDRVAGDDVVSGAINGASAMRIRATADAESSSYQKIVALVQEASESRSPMVRLADKVAVPFTIAALALAAFGWYISGTPLRAAQILVVATPCPLLIAAPVAFMAGMSRSAREGIIVKDGGTIERLSRVRTAAFDKTGTLTFGEPKVTQLLPAPWLSETDLLRGAAAVEAYSTHPLARAITATALREGLDLPEASDAREVVSAGFCGVVGGAEVLVGKEAWILDHTPGAQVADDSHLDSSSGVSLVHVAIGGRYAGAIALQDEVRPDAVATVAHLLDMGLDDIVMLTGDAADTAQRVGADLAVTTIRAELTPQGKVDAIEEIAHRPVMMVGDGVNDAPVLAASDVGVAMGARGSSAASETADVVIMTDQIHRAAQAVGIGKRTTQVAMQAIGIGVALSVGLMVVALTGVMPAIVGAGAQELVDLACILWALRAMRPGPAEPRLADRDAPATGCGRADGDCAACSLRREELLACA